MKEGWHAILRGGPADGFTFWWRGPDLIYAAEHQAPSIVQPSPAPPPARIINNRYCYKLSERTEGRHIVFDYRRDCSW